jgi:phytoene dehydrogenase-like protein
MTATQHDVVVVGAGHNALTAAAYLARAGLDVLVLEKQDWLGGGVVTKELTVPGFKHDPHATSHWIIQANPMITRDELRLQADFGLQYIRPEISYISVFDDDTALVGYNDIDMTCESIAQFSQKDAAAYRRLADEIAKLEPMLLAGMFVPPAPFGSFMSLLDQSKEGRQMMDMLFKSAYDLIMERFENEKVRIHLLKFASEISIGSEEKGTGIMLFMTCGLSHSHPAGQPVGGSGALSDALVRCIEHHGGSCRTNSEVRRVVVEAGKATGVELAGGEVIKARRAVVGSIHPHLLGKYVDGLDPDLVHEAGRVDLGDFGGIKLDMALNQSPTYRATDLAHKAFYMECLPSDLNTFRRTFDSYRYGELPAVGTPVILTNTDHDPSRAPDGKHVMYLWNNMPYELANGGPQRWDEIKDEVADWLLEDLKKYADNMGPENIIARHVDSPLDHARHSDSFQRGRVFGIAAYLHQSMGRRPTPELAQYAVPGADGLYLTGPFMHPGGGVIGGGRPTAIKIMEDLGIDFDTVIAGQASAPLSASSAR